MRKNIPVQKDDGDPRSGDAKSTESRILSAALREFSAKGFDGARLQKIADNAGVNKALLHYYFRSKERLYDEVIKNFIFDVLAKIRSQFQTKNPDRDTGSLIKTIVTSYIRTMQINPEFPRLFMREMAEAGKHIPVIFDGICALNGDLPKKILEVLGSGSLDISRRRTGALHAFINIMGMCAASFFAQPIISILSEKLFNTGSIFDEEYFQNRIDYITEMARHGINGLVGNMDSLL
jgi:AcrR family transcriptional regulator